VSFVARNYSLKHLTWRLGKKRKARIIIPILLSFFLSSLIPQLNSDAQASNILNVYHSPNNPTPLDQVRIFLEVQDDSNILWVRLVYCTIDPYICFTPPLNMTKSSSNHYEALITRTFQSGKEIGYNITIRYEDGSEEKAPTKIGYQNNLIVEPVPDALYFYYIISDEKGTSPDFTLTDIEGNSITLSNLRGKVVLVNFFDIRNLSSLDSIDVLKEVRGLYGSDLIMISVEVNDSTMKSDLVAFKENRGANWILALNQNRTSLKYGVLSIPKTFVIDKRGYLIYEANGTLSIESLKSVIDSALAEAQVNIDIPLIIALSLAVLVILLMIVFVKLKKRGRKK